MSGSKKKRSGSRGPSGRRGDDDEEDLVFEDMYEDEYESEEEGGAGGAGGAGKGKAKGKDKGKGKGKGKGSVAAGGSSVGGGGGVGAAAGAAAPAGAGGGSAHGSGAAADGDDAFEDDEEEEEDASDDDGDDGEGDGDEDDDEDDDETGKHLRVFRPGIDALGEGEELEVSNEAYVMLHHLEGQWPCLSFDVVPDKLGAARSRFPVTATIVCGTQADRQNHNRLSVMKASELHKTQHDDGGCLCGMGGGRCWGAPPQTAPSWGASPVAAACLVARGPRWFVDAAADAPPPRSGASPHDGSPGSALLCCMERVGSRSVPCTPHMHTGARR
jgi:hypothetical protein